MTARAGRYRATRAPDQALASVLPAYADALAEASLNGANGEVARARLAAAVQLPMASVRGAVSSFHDALEEPDTIRLCGGLSCALAGGGALAQQVAQGPGCREVHCLGYCDRSPTALTASGHIVTHLDDAAAWSMFEAAAAGQVPSPASPSSIRCTARHPLITTRLGRAAPAAATVPAYDGLRAALALEPDQISRVIADAGLRGRGGAAYPTGRKWALAAAAQGTPKFIIANGDEGDPGSFIDRELMEGDPHAILEGMAIAAHAVGAERGIVFVRSEYPAAARRMQAAIEDAVAAGRFGTEWVPHGRTFVVEVVQGLGSYVCGEETALLAAIEGRRGEVAPRPPYPVESGLFGKPTVVDNVETLANVPWILRHGAAAFAAMGTAESPGTKALCFNHGFARPGIVEVEFGVSMRRAIEELAGGAAPGTEIEAVLIGGPMGSLVTPDRWDVPICFAAMAQAGINLGHGGMVAIPRGADWSAILGHLLSFMRHESCGKCIPCALGSRRAHELAQGGLDHAALPEFEAIMELMQDASLCAFGRETPGPIGTLLERFGDRALGRRATNGPDGLSP